MRRVLNDGETVAPRGQLTFEVPDTTVIIENLDDAHVFNTHRRVNLKIAATEYLHLLGGISSLEQLDLASKGRFSQFADGGRLKGAYGPRIRHQLPRVVDLLRRDPDTRQAVLTIWNGQELATPSRDVPCTQAIQFRLRDDRLTVRVSMRSSDVVLGAPYDWFMFSRLGMSVAAVLGVDLGSFTLTTGSMHLYERDLGIANDVEDGGVLSKPRLAVPPALTPVRHSGEVPSIAKLSSVAEDICLDWNTSQLGFDYVGADWYLANVPRLSDHTKCRGCHSVFKTRDMYQEDPDFCQACG
jgi:thymidylate synthase